MQHAWYMWWYIRRVLVGKPEGERPLGKFGCRLEGGVKINVRKILIMLGRVWTGVVGLEAGTRGNAVIEVAGAVKGREEFELLLAAERGRQL